MNTITVNKNRLLRYKTAIVYGISLAFMLFLLQWLALHYILFDYSIEIYMGFIALIFMSLGIWLALKLVAPKVETRIIEKEVYINNPAHAAEINHREIEKLGISKREMEVLLLMANGLSNEEIAGELFISPNTVKTHSSNIFLKLDVKRRTQAVEKAKRLHIIP